MFRNGNWLWLASAVSVTTGMTGSIHAQSTTRVSIATGGTQGNNNSFFPAISADGRIVAFESVASNLVTGDTNFQRDIFAHDRQTSQTIRVSVSSAGVESNGLSLYSAVSGDGRFIGYASSGGNLVAGDTNNTYDIFVYDMQTAQTTRVSVGLTNGGNPNGDSRDPSFSSDGRYVAFASFASNLVGGDNNGTADIFLYDRQTGTTTMESVSSGGVQGNSTSAYPTISADGRYVSFLSYASNLVANDTNGIFDMFVHDRQTGQTRLISVASDGTQTNDGGTGDRSTISGNGRFVVFRSMATTLVTGDTNGKADIFVHDLQTSLTTRVSVTSAGVQSNGDSAAPWISNDGRYVVFDSFGTNMGGNGNPQVHLHDRQTAQTTVISVSNSNVQGNSDCVFPQISGNGRFVAFHFWGNNLVANDTNNVVDIIVRDRGVQCIAADTNCDGVVNIDDLVNVITHWGPCPGACPPACAGDINGNCVVDIDDLVAVITSWG
jgi:hypothetical protein